MPDRKLHVSSNVLNEINRCFFSNGLHLDSQALADTASPQVGADDPTGQTPHVDVCGVEVKRLGCYLRRLLRHLASIQNYEISNESIREIPVYDNSIPSSSKRPRAVHNHSYQHFPALKRMRMS
ncbi:hypothetical protein TNCV_853321 [Trichonephila clavipes]|nr:hypothetical protein TNCV_853321 [Trichonephila clavipes]